MSGLVIRRMRAQDLDQAVLLDCMSFSLPWPPSAYLHELNNTGGKAWVAEQVLEAPLEYHRRFPVPVADLVQPAGARAVVGVIVVWLIVDEAHIATIATHPDSAGRASRRKLLCVALKEAAEEACSARCWKCAQGTKPPRTSTGNSVLRSSDAGRVITRTITRMRC